MKLTRHAVRRNIATSVIVCALVVLGLYGLWQLPVNFLPDMTYPMVRVHIWWRGATPDEIDKSLADPIERQMATVDGLDYIESSSIEGMYTLVANFRYGVDINTAYQDAQAAMARVARLLPKEIDAPVIIKADPSQLPIVQLTVSSDQWVLVKLRMWTEDWLQDKILAVPGVAGTEIVGGLKREIRVNLDANALEKYGLSLTTVLKRLREENLEQFAGRVTAGPREFIVRTVEEYRSLEQIKSVVLAQKGTARVVLSDVARVEDAHEEVRVITRLNGKPCIKLNVLKQADANTVEVAAAVSRKLQDLTPSLPGDIRLGMVENQADYVGAALAGVRNTALEAAALVILTVYLFLGSWRQVVLMMLAVPLTLVLNFGLMRLAGFSLNIFSLGGLVVAMGVILDNSIVVLENITRLQHESPSAPAEDVAVEGTSQVGPAVIAATLSFLALFVPFLLVPGLTSLLFKELILVVAGVVLVSLLMAVTVTPMLAALLLGGRARTHGQGRFERVFGWVTDQYGALLGLALRRRWLVVGAFALVAVVGALFLLRVGSEFLPSMDDGRIMVKVRLPTGASVEQTNQALGQIEAKLTGDPIVESTFTLVGGKVWGLYTYEIANEGEVDIRLVPRHQRSVSTQAYIQKLRPIVGGVFFPGAKFIVAQMKVPGLRKIGEADVEVKLQGPDVDRLFALAQETARTMSQLGHFRNVYVAMDLNKPEYQVQVDRTRATELGVSVTDVATTLRFLVGGAIATQYRDGNEYYNIRAIVPEQRLTSRQDVSRLLLNTANGNFVRVSDVAAVVPATGPVEIARENQVKQVVVRGDAAGVSVGQALAELQAALQAVEKPSGYEMAFGGQAKMMGDMQRSLVFILAFALFFAFVVLAVQFNSLKLPVVILASLPACLAGLFFALWITSLPIGATVVIGILVVVAGVTNGGVLLIVLAEQLVRDQGLSPVAAVIEASKVRFRARMMITLMIITGFIPLALNLEEGGDMLQPMAVAAIGGLGVGIFVALFLMPCLYVLLSRRPEPAVEAATWSEAGASAVLR
jgi:hydrophobe/amphiphile efflux-1 (HAE1) family protein